MTRLEIDTTPLGGAPCVTVRGEVDISTTQELEQALDAAVRDSVGVLLLDMCELDFVDSTGINLLLRTRALLGREDRALAIVCPPGPVRRVFELTGVVDLFIFYATRDDAVDALVPVDRA